MRIWKFYDEVSFVAFTSIVKNILEVVLIESESKIDDDDDFEIAVVDANHELTLQDAEND